MKLQQLLILVVPFIQPSALEVSLNRSQRYSSLNTKTIKGSGSSLLKFIGSVRLDELHSVSPYFTCQSEVVTFIYVANIPFS